MMKIKLLGNTVSVTTANQVSAVYSSYVVTTSANTLISIGPNNSIITGSIVLPAGVHILQKNSRGDFWTANVAASFTPTV